MKKLLSVFLLCGFLFLVSCGDEKCISCEVNALFLVVTSEACEDGSDLKVSVSAAGVTADTIYKNTTLETFQKEQEAAGGTCK
jgi:hypothetical protein